MRVWRALGILALGTAFVAGGCTPDQITAFTSVATVVVQPDTIDLDIDAHQTLNAEAYNALGLRLLSSAPTWTSANPTIAQVSVIGDVLAMDAGTTTITASVDGKEGRATVKVRRPAVATVSVDPTSVTVAVNQQSQLTATVRSASSKVLTGRTVTWTSDAPSVASVSATGLVKGLASGNATITATCEGKTGSASVTVSASQNPVATVTVAPATVDMTTGQTAQLTATAKDASGSVLTNRTITWSSSNTAAATVSGAGLVSAQAAGSATITATSEGKSGTSAVTVSAPSGNPNDPELPRIILDTHFVPPTGQTIAVPAGGDLQAALNAAQPCDVITLAAGATYAGSFTLPNKSGACFITIRSSAADASLPAEGSRMTPAYASALPKLVSNNTEPALKTAPGAHHYRLMELEIALGSSVTLNYGLTLLGDGSSAQNSLSQVPTNLILDRVYIHGNATGSLSRCVGLNSASTAVIDSYLSDCHASGFDSQAIGGWNGPGPYKIVNNYLEGAGETVMFGGADPAISNLTPSDIEVRHNHFSRPTSWKGVWTVKNHLELKHAQRVLIEGNIFENHWADAQDGFIIGWKSVNQDGSAPWSVVRDVTFRYNRVRNAGAGINTAANPEPYVCIPLSRVKIANNIFENINVGIFTGHGRLFQILDGPADITIEHNSTFNSAASNAAMDFDGAPPQAARFVFRNNVTTLGTYEVFGSNIGIGKAALDYYAVPGYVFQRNVLIASQSASAYPAGNFFPASTAAVGFVAYASGNYRLASGSAYSKQGTDGLDPGADIDAVEAATLGVIVP